MKTPLISAHHEQTWQNCSVPPQLRARPNLFGHSTLFPECLWKGPGCFHVVVCFLPVLQENKSTPLHWVHLCVGHHRMIITSKFNTQVLSAAKHPINCPGNFHKGPPTIRIWAATWDSFVAKGLPPPQNERKTQETFQKVWNLSLLPPVVSWLPQYLLSTQKTGGLPKGMFSTMPHQQVCGSAKLFLWSIHRGSLQGQKKIEDS